MGLKKYGFLESDKLVGRSNYYIWAFKIEQVLDGLGLWEIIDPTSEAYGGSAEDEDGDLFILHRDISTRLTPQDFEKKRKLAVNVFPASVSSDCILTVASYKHSPRDIWLQFKLRFESSALQRKIDLRDELRNISMSEDESIESFLKRIDIYVFQLTIIMEKVDDKELIHIVLRALPSKWNAFKMSFGMNLSKDNSITFSHLCQWLSAEEGRMQSVRMSAAITEESLAVYRKHANTSKAKGKSKHIKRPTQPDYEDRKNTVCTYCKNKGHRESQCWFKQTEKDMKTLSINQLREVQKTIRDMKKQHSNLAEASTLPPDNSSSSSSDEEQIEEVNLVAMLSQLATRDETEWILDSGARSHFSNSKQSLSNFAATTTSANVTTAGGAQLPVTGKGKVKFPGNKAMSNVLYVPSIQKNLLSVGQLADQGHNVLFTSRHCYVMDNVDPVKIFLRGSRDNSRLYKLDSGTPLQHTLPISSSKSSFLLHPAVSANSETPSSVDNPSIGRDGDKIDLWHRRLGHINYKKLSSMTNKELVLGVPRLAYLKKVCEICALGKHHRSIIPRQSLTVFKTFATDSH